MANIDKVSLVDDIVLRNSQYGLDWSCWMVDTTRRRWNPHHIACKRDIFHLLCNFRNADFLRWLRNQKSNSQVKQALVEELMKIKMDR
jgi:hypothetical protein